MEPVAIIEYGVDAMRRAVDENRRLQGLPPMVPASTDQFSAVTDNGRRAYEAYVAIWARYDGEHIAISAPSMDALERVWISITQNPLETEKAQKVLIVSAKSAQAGDVVRSKNEADGGQS